MEFKKVENLEKFLNNLEKICKRNSYPIIGPEKGRFLGELVKKYRPKKILEIGTLVGYSAIIMASNLGGTGRIVSLEANYDSAKLANRNIKRVGLENRINIIIGKALKIIPELKEGFDFVFIDAEKKEYLKYLRAVEPLLSKKAVVVADNIGKFSKDVEDYLRYVRNSGRYKSKNYFFCQDSVELSIKSL